MLIDKSQSHGLN